MGYQGISTYNGLRPYPLIAIIRFGSGVDTMARIYFSLEDHFRSRGTHIPCRSRFSFFQAGQKLHFYGNGPILLLKDSFGVLRSEEHTSELQSREKLVC